MANTITDGSAASSPAASTAGSWTYSGWRRESGSTAQRAMLVLHIEEVETKLADFQHMGAQSQKGSRFELTEYLKKLEKKLAEYDAALGLSLDADDKFFIRAIPEAD